MRVVLDNKKCLCFRSCENVIDVQFSTLKHFSINETCKIFYSRIKTYSSWQLFITTFFNCWIIVIVNQRFWWINNFLFSDRHLTISMYCMLRSLESTNMKISRDEEFDNRTYQSYTEIFSFKWALSDELVILCFQKKQSDLIIAFKRRRMIWQSHMSVFWLIVFR